MALYVSDLSMGVVLPVVGLKPTYELSRMNAAQEGGRCGLQQSGIKASRGRFMYKAT